MPPSRQHPGGVRPGPIAAGAVDQRRASRICPRSSSRRLRNLACLELARQVAGERIVRCHLLVERRVDPRMELHADFRLAGGDRRRAGSRRPASDVRDRPVDEIDGHAALRPRRTPGTSPAAARGRARALHGRAAALQSNSSSVSTVTRYRQPKSGAKRAIRSAGGGSGIAVIAAPQSGDPRSRRTRRLPRLGYDRSPPRSSEAAP